MSELSFKTYCIENYAEYKNISSSVVFKKFSDSNLLTHLNNDYEDLHGMGKEFLMDYFDKWLCNIYCKDSELEEFLMADTHHLIKTLTIPQIAELLMKNDGLSEDEALKTIYESPIEPLLEDDSMGLYGQSALYLYGLIKDGINL